MKDFKASIEEMLPVMLEVLGSGGEFRLFPKGTSMMPLLRQGTDSVILVSPDKMRKGDIYLFRRQNGDFVLHRLIQIEKDDTLSFRGDNQAVLECGIRREQVLARVLKVLKGEKEVNSRSFLYRMTHLSAPARAWRFRNRKSN